MSTSERGDASGRYARAIIVNPPNPPGYVSNKDSMGGFGQLYPVGAPPFPPLDMPCLAAVLMDADFGVEVIEAGALGLTSEELLARLRSSSPGDDTLLLVRTSLPTIDFDLGVCADLAERLSFGGVALFGPVLSSLLWHVEKNPALDYLLLGEPDGPALELMRGDPLEQIAGLRYHTDDGWQAASGRRFETDLDSLPFPRWDLLPHERYVIPKSSTAGTLKALPMLTSRGCPYGCSYCPYPIGQGLKWRYRSPENVADEMEQLVSRYGVEYILFRDPMFSLKQSRVVELCEEILRRGIKVMWKCETRVDCLDEATIAIMARAGCTGINFGIESTDPEIQEGVHRKPILVQEFLDKIGMCKKHDISTFAFFIVGLPGDTIETILKTIRFALVVQPTWTQFTVATPFIGTPLHEWAVGHGLVRDNAYEMISSHVGGPGNDNLTAAQIRRLHGFAQRLQTIINRRGVLKDMNRQDVPYRTARAFADLVSRLAAAAYLAIGEAYLRRTIGPMRKLSPAPSA